MVEVDRRDDRDLGVDARSCCPTSPPMPDLDDGDVDRGVGEDRVGQRGDDLEERQRDVELAVDEFDVGRELAVGLDERAVADRLAVDDDAFGDRRQVRAGVAAGAQAEAAQQLVDHAGRAGLAVRAGEVDRAEGALRIAEQVDQRLHALVGRVDVALAPAAEDARPRPARSSAAYFSRPVATTRQSTARRPGSASRAALMRAMSASAAASRSRTLATPAPAPCR